MIARLAIPSDLRERMRGGILWSFLASAGIAGGTFASNLVVAQVVGREEFGRFSILRNTLVVLATLAPLAMGLTATKFTAELRDAGRQRLGTILALCDWVTRIGALLAAGALWASADWISTRVLNASELGTPLRWIGVAVAFVVLGSLPAGALAGLEAFRPLALNALVVGAATVATVAVGALRAGVRGAAIGLAICSAIQWALLRGTAARELARRGIKPTLAFAKSEVSVLRGFALPAALGGLSMMPAQWIANALLARRPAGFDELGLFGAANTLRSLVLFVPGLVLVVSVAILNQQRSAGDADKYHRVYWTNLVMTGGTASAVALTVVALGHPILRRFGPRFEEGYAVLIVMLLAATLECTTVAAYQLVQAEGRMWRILCAVVLPRDTLLVTLAFTLTRSHGALGLATAYAVANGVGLMGAVFSSLLLSRASSRRPPHAHRPLPVPFEPLEP